jgi:hypothetical protein
VKGVGQSLLNCEGIKITENKIPDDATVIYSGGRIRGKDFNALKLDFYVMTDTCLNCGSQIYSSTSPSVVPICIECFATHKANERSRKIRLNEKGDI